MQVVDKVSILVVPQSVLSQATTRYTKHVSLSLWSQIDAHYTSLSKIYYITLLCYTAANLGKAVGITFIVST